jgi:hypothetical protein
VTERPSAEELAAIAAAYLRLRALAAPSAPPPSRWRRAARLEGTGATVTAP